MNNNMSEHDNIRIKWESHFAAIHKDIDGYISSHYQPPYVEHDLDLEDECDEDDLAILSSAGALPRGTSFFGGGSLAAGGWGMAGGAMVLGGLVAGPALFVMGLVTGKAAEKSLDKAKINRLEAVQMAEQLDTASKQCEAIRRRTYMFYNLLARLDSFFLPCIYKMEDIVKAEGYDYSCYTEESKKAIAACASIAVSIKSVLDTQLLTDDGMLTDESAGVVVDTEEFVNKMVLIR